jgi:hypothetical protein
LGRGVLTVFWSYFCWNSCPFFYLGCTVVLIRAQSNEKEVDMIKIIRKDNYMILGYIVEEEQE